MLWYKAKGLTGNQMEYAMYPERRVRKVGIPDETQNPENQDLENPHVVDSFPYATNADEALANLKANIDTITLDETNEDEADIQESLFAPSVTQNGSSNGFKSNHKSHGGGGHQDGLLKGFYQMPTVKPGRQTYAVFEKNPPLDSGRRFYLAGVERCQWGLRRAYSYAFSESEIKEVTQAWIRQCKKLQDDL